MASHRPRFSWVCVFAALFLSAPHIAAETERTEPRQWPRTNIVILLVDDLGWGDVGYHNPEVATPNIDNIAARGVEFDRFYVNPTCSPTRASLLTGQFSTTHGVNGPIQWRSEEGLPLEWQTLPGYLKRAGYQTHLVGKWHLGAASTAFWPQHRGFDSFYGHLNGGIGYFDHVFSGGLDWQNGGVTIRERGYTTQLIKRAAVDLIENRSTEDEPLFLLVSFNAIHTPIEEPQDAGAKHQGRATLLRMIASLDSAVGEILNSLMQQPWGKDTVIIFASDNGGSPPKPWWIEMLIPPLRDGYSSNGVLKQGKGSVFEGGIRVPAAIWWPSKVESDQPLSEVVHIADVLPTLLDFMELKIPSVDGRSLKGLLLEGSLLKPRPFVVANFGSEAMIDWPWKIVREGSLPITPDFFKSDTWHLYNIEADPGEVVNLREKFPQRFERMRNNLLQIPRRESVQFTTDGSWDTFGGHETRAPWAEAARGHDDN